MQPPAASTHGRRALLAAPLVGLLSLGAMAVSLPQALAAEADETDAVTTAEPQQTPADPDTPGRDGSHEPGPVADDRSPGDDESDAKGEGETHAEAEGETHAEAEGETHAEGEGETHAEAEGETHAEAEGEARHDAGTSADEETTLRVDGDEEEADLHAQLVVLVGSGDVTAVIVLLQDLDAQETDDDASAASLDAVLAQIVTAIEAGTYDTAVAAELLVALRSSSTYGAELERRIETGTLDATLVAVLEGDAADDTTARDETDTDGAAPTPAPTASPSPTPTPAPSPTPTTTTAPATGGQVEGTATTSGAAGVAADVQTTSQVAGEQLPMTGMDTLQLALLALAALGIGAAALAATRRTAVARPTDDR
jgi:hypothetical protein